MLDDAPQAVIVRCPIGAGGEYQGLVLQSILHPLQSSGNDIEAVPWVAWPRVAEDRDRPVRALLLPAVGMEDRRVDGRLEIIGRAAVGAIQLGQGRRVA